MKRPFLVSTLAAALLLAHPGLAPAQESPDAAAPRLQLGPMEVHPSLALSETYRDNVYSVNTGKTNDFVLTVTPALGLALPFRTHRLGLYAQAEFASYADHTDLDTDNYLGALDAEFNIGNFVNLKFGDTYRDQYETVSQSPTGKPGRYTQNNPWLSATYAFVDVSKVRLDYAYTVYDYDQETYPRSRGEGLFSAYLYYRVLPRTSLFVEYDNQVVDYDSAAATLDSTSHFGQVGATWEISMITKGTVKAGYQKKDFKAADQKDYETWVALVELTSALTDTLHLKLAGGRQVNEAKYDGPSYYTNTGLTAELTAWFLDRLSGTVKAGYGIDEYNAPIVGDPKARTDNTLSAGLGVKYSFQPWLSLSLGYDYVNRDSNIDSRSAVENAASLQVKAEL